MIRDDFSENLFWDADPADLDFERNKRYVVQRVLERGTVNDLGQIFRLYGMPDVVETAKSLRTLEPRALSFVSCIPHRCAGESFAFGGEPRRQASSKDPQEAAQERSAKGTSLPWNWTLWEPRKGCHCEVKFVVG